MADQEVYVRGFQAVAQDLLDAGQDAADALALKIDYMGQGVKFTTDENGYIKNKNGSYLGYDTAKGQWVQCGTCPPDSSGYFTNSSNQKFKAAKAEDIRSIKSTCAGSDVTSVNLEEMSTSDYMVGQMEIGQLTAIFEAINAANTVNNQKVSEAAKKIEQGAR